MEKVAIAILSESLAEAKDFAEEMEKRIPELLAEALMVVDEPSSTQCAVFGMPTNDLRGALTCGRPEMPEIFLQADRKVLIATDQKAHAFLVELKAAVKAKTQSQPRQGANELCILCLSDALGHYLRRHNFGNVWIQESQAMSTENELQRHVDQVGSYAYRLNPEAERQLMHLTHDSVMKIRLQQHAKAKTGELTQNFQYAVRCLAKDVNTIVFEDWAQPLFDQWDQTRVPMTLLNATTIYMQEAMIVAIKTPPPRD